MGNETWECQGRQAHGWFGDGTCADGGEDDNEGRESAQNRRANDIDHIAFAAIGLLPQDERRKYERWLHEGGLARLQDAIPRWVQAANLAPERFRTQFFGEHGSATVAGLAQEIAARLAGMPGDNARLVAARSLADLVRTLRMTGMNRAFQAVQTSSSDAQERHTDFPSSYVTKENIDALASIILSEAGGVSPEAMIAVGATVINRMHRNHTTSVADVWGAYSHKVLPTAAARVLAEKLLSGNIKDPTNGATHFYSPHSMPKEGEHRHGDTAGGLESVQGVHHRNYKPSFSNNFERKMVPGIEEKDFKFYKQPENGHPVR